MKKQIIKLTLGLAVCGAFINGCKKDVNNTPPVITENGSSSQTIFLGSAYTDPGATATDNAGKTITVTSTGTVDVTHTGTYTIKYDAVDANGNAAVEVTRTVNVIIDVTTNLVGTYNVTDLVAGTSTPYPDNITASTTANRFLVNKFADYTNGGVYMDISGTYNNTVTLSNQTVVCGNPSASRQFSGSGNVSTDGKTITVNYTEVTNGTTTTGIETYVRQ